MTPTAILVVAVSAVPVVVVAALILFGRHPRTGDATSSRQRPDRSANVYGKADRPAGPGAETMDPERLGGDHSRPSAENQSRSVGD